MARQALNWLVLFIVFGTCWLPAAEPGSAGNRIDDYLAAQFAAAGVQPSKPATDSEFLRRLTQTSIGQLPTADEVRAFVDDATPDKRARKIHELLGHPLHAAMWATRFCEWTGNSLDALAAEDADTKLALSQMWHEWLRVRFEKNVPYDQLVRSVLTSTSRGDNSLNDWIQREVDRTVAIRSQKTVTLRDHTTLDLFYRRVTVQNEYPVREIAERVASSFLGVRINCARCHDHPFDRWTKRDYESFVSIFQQVRHDMSPELRAEVARRLQARRERTTNAVSNDSPLPRLTEVYLTTLSESAGSTVPKVLGGPELTRERLDLRVALVDWMVEQDNAFFARNMVNRVWAHYFGLGLVEPWDGLSSTKETANTKLLSDLALHFSQGGYNLRELEELILSSSTWQLSSIPHETQASLDSPFARSYVRLPPAETVIDMWHRATGIECDFGTGPLRGLKAVEIGADRLPGNRWDEVLDLFGQPNRAETCDCGLRNRPSVRQMLTLMSDPELVADVGRGRLATLLKREMSDNALIDELFLSTLSRWPSADERAMARKAVDGQDRQAGFENILSSLLVTQEFLTIH